MRKPLVSKPFRRGVYCILFAEINNPTSVPARRFRPRPHRRLLRSSGNRGRSAPRWRPLRLAHGLLQQAPGRHAVRKRVVDLRHQHDAAVGQALKHPSFPKRPVARELRPRDPRNGFVHLTWTAGLGDLRPKQVSTDVEVRIVYPHRVMNAARHRLRRELARTLRCLGGNDLSAVLRRQAQRERPDGRYHQALRLLEGYPTWEPEEIADAERFFQVASTKQRRARVAGSEVDAAINDPRWLARRTLAAKEEVE